MGKKFLKELLTEASTSVKKEKDTKKYKFKKVMKENTEEVNIPSTSSENLTPAINSENKVTEENLNIKVLNYIEEFFKSLIKNLVLDGISNTAEIKKSIDDLELNYDKSNLYNLLVDIETITEMSFMEASDLIESSINNMNTEENINKVLKTLSESKKIPLSFSEYRKNLK